LISAYSEMPERILCLVDEYLMKGEIPELLIPIIERVHKLAPRSTGAFQRGPAAS
jgi:hypothetical protein